MVGWHGGGGGSGLYPAFNHSWSYHRLQVGFGGSCRCMRVLVSWVNVDLSCLGQTIYARQLWVPKSLTQFCHRWSEINHSYHFTDSEQRPAGCATHYCQAPSANLPLFTSLVCRGWVSNPGLPHPERTTILRRRFRLTWGVWEGFQPKFPINMIIIEKSSSLLFSGDMRNINYFMTLVYFS